MSSKAISEKPEGAPHSGWQPPHERAPSTIVAAETMWPRIIGCAGLVLLVLGGVTLYLYAKSPTQGRIITPNWARFFSLLGVGAVLYHALVDTDIQVRRLYQALAYLLLFLGTLFAWLPIKDTYGSHFVPWGVLCFVLGYVMMLAFLRHEIEHLLRDYATSTVGILGGVMAVVGFFFSTFSIFGTRPDAFLFSHGILLQLLGLLFVATFILLRPTADLFGLRSGIALGGTGCLFFVIALYRAWLIPLLASWKWVETPAASYLMPSGLALMVLGMLYMMIAVLLCSELPLVVLVRRELLRFFCTPIAYIVLLASVVLAGALFWIFSRYLQISSERGGGLPEPIISEYLLGMGGLVPIITLMVIVPLLTMGLVSEEHRTGTLEMLMTVRVSEMTVIVSKFIAALTVFVLFWAPWAFYLISLYVFGQQALDYRPLVSFYLAIFFIGFNFMAMGLFFSCLTQNQLTAGILSFLGVMVMLVLYFLKGLNRDNTWGSIFAHTSFIELWINAVQGKLPLRMLIYNASAGIFWLVLSVKALEVRRWR